MADFNNIIGGLNIPSQIPLNVKEFCADEATLAYLGLSDNLAFQYHDQLVVTCLEEKTKWIWREVQEGEENTGLIPLDFTYPSLTSIFNVDYSGKTFNFFPYIVITTDNIDDYAVAGPAGPTGPQGPTGATGPSGSSTPTTISNTDTISVSGNGSSGTPYQLSVVNLQKTISGNITLSNSDNFYTIFCDNGSSAITITVPSTLVSNFCIAVVQLGTGDVMFTQGSSTTIRTAIGYKIKGQYFSVILEKIENTSTYILSNATKV